MRGEKKEKEKKKCCCSVYLCASTHIGSLISCAKLCCCGHDATKQSQWCTDPLLGPINPHSLHLLPPPVFLSFPFSTPSYT